MKRRLLYASAAVVAIVSTAAYGQLQRPLRVLVASAPAGPSDVQARLIQPRMSEALGQTAVVDNRPSANGIVASELCSNATPDGYTTCVGNSGTHAVNATLYRKLTYDPVKDFVPITQFSTTGLVIAASSKLPGTTIRDLAAYAKQHAGKTVIGIPGATGQLAGDELWARLGVKMTNVNYKGSAPAEMAVLSGESHIAVLTPLASMPHLKSGRMKGYGITSPHRHPLLPDLPTIAEQGLKGYDIQFWNGLFAPAKTPDAMVRRIHKAVLTALHSPEVKQRFAQLGLLIVGNSPEEFAQVVKTDVEKFRRIILQSGIQRL